MRTLVTWCLLLLSLLYSTCALSVPSQTIVEQRSLVASSAVSGGASVDDVNGSLLSRVVVGGYFGLWYALNVYYNSKWEDFTFCESLIAAQTHVHSSCQQEGSQHA